MKLQLQWKNQFEFAGFYAAKEKGFYKDAGLDVEFRELQKNEDIVEEVIKGHAQYGLAYSSIVAEYMNNKPIVLLANFFKQSPLVLITQKDIQTPSQLKGKKIMGISNNIHNMILWAMLHRFDIHLSDVIEVPTNFKIDDFIAKKVDAMSVFTTNEIYILDKKGVQYNVFDPVSFGTKYYDQNLFTTKKELLEHPQRVAKFKEASIKGWNYALSHEEEIVDLILKKYNTQHKSKDALMFEAKQVKQIMLPKIYPIGSVDPQKISMIAESFMQAGFIKGTTKRDLKDFIYADYADKTDGLGVTAQERDYLEQKKEIKMCIDPNWMPFEAFDMDGNNIGMTADFFKIFSKKIGIPIKAVRTKTWSESVEFAKERKCDIFSLAMETPEKKKYMNFTKPYMSVPLVIATKPNVTYVEKLSDLVNEKIGIVKDYAFGEILRKKYPYLQIVDVRDIDDGLQKVADGKLFGFIGTTASIAYKFQTKFTGELKISGKFDEKWELSVGVRNDDAMLYAIFTKAVKELSEDEKARILNKHIAITYEKGFDYTLFWRVFVFISFIVFILVYRQYTIDRLNRELRQKFNDELERSKDKDKVIFHQSKLISMGEMIENIAHQWRQPLSQVNSAVLVIDDLLYKYNIRDDMIEKKLYEIEDLTKYMSKTIDDFKNFFDREKKREYFLLNELVKKSINMVESTFKENGIDLVMALKGTVICHGYPNEFQQVMVVILNNAKDALVNNNIEAPVVRVTIKQTQKHNHIIVCDNGGGIDADIIDKIFEPYFTTKHKSQGTGLGLYISKIIIEESLKGELRVKNTLNGVCFEIILKREDLGDE
ncbi:ABC transporter substrate-binding protein [bacterium]|nr:ABC transporter substrate-binding protein [bacterium]MBU1884591.1 ABC transporter substrate-binding protein [bacterium]